MSGGLGPLGRSVWGALLRAFPPRFRDRYGGEMLAFFEAERQGRGWWGRVALWTRAAVAMPIQGWRERSAERRQDGRGGMMTGWTKEIALAFRGLARRPGFAAATVGTVGLGMGAAITVFTIVDHVVLRPLPYAEPERLVSLWTTFDRSGDTPFGVSIAVQHDYALDSRVLEAMGGFGQTDGTWTGNGDATRVPMVWFRGEPFRVTGIRAALGRLPTLADQESGAAHVAVVTDGFWRASLGADPNVLGRTLELDGTPVEIIGVLESGARLPNVTAGIWRPQARSRSDIVDRSGHWMDVLARLRPGESVASLRSEIERVHAEWAVRYAGEHSPGHSGHDLRAAPAQDWYFGPLRATGRLLLGAVGLLLLLACANVAALLLARGEGRMDEFAVRRALGAGRGRLARSLLLESGAIALLGGAVGVALAELGTRLIVAAVPDGVPRLQEVAVDGRVLTVALGVALVSGLLFGSLPALRTGSARPGTRGETGPGRGLSRSLAVLVTVQLALAVLLVSGAGLLTRSVHEMLGVDPGVATEGRVTARIAIPFTNYRGREDVLAFWERLDAELEAVPGIEAVGLTRSLPLGDGLRTEGILVPSSAPADDAGILSTAAQSVTHDWFEVAGIPVVEGRGFRPTDREDTEYVAVLNQEAARRHFPDGSAVGALIRPLWIAEEHGLARVIGIVGDVVHEGAREGVHPEVYLALEQAAPNEINSLRSLAVVIRSGERPETIASELRRVVRGIDPSVPVDEITTWTAVAEGAVREEGLIATLVGVFAAIALALAGLGTYGLVSFTTARRTREVGVRIALGAAPGRVAFGVVRRSVLVGLGGIAAGVALAAAVAPALRAFLFGISPLDPVALGGAAVALALVTLTAAAVPARRASAVDPVRALREEA